MTVSSFKDGLFFTQVLGLFSVSLFDQTHSLAILSHFSRGIGIRSLGN